MLKADQVWTGIIICASLVLFGVSRNIISGAAYPRAMLILILVLAFVSLVISVRKGRAETRQTISREKGNKAKEISVLVVSPFIYAILWSIVGFLVATVIFLFGLFSYKRVSLVKSIITAVVAAIVIEYIFGTLFQVPLPMLGWLPLL